MPALRLHVLNALHDGLRPLRLAGWNAASLHKSELHRGGAAPHETPPESDAMSTLGAAAPEKSKFASRIFVRVDDDGELFAYYAEAEAIEDEGPTPVATYRLDDIRLLRKKVEEVAA
jgi:hypothetical protein